MSAIHAYEIPDTDLTLMVGKLGDARRPVLALRSAAHGVRVMASFHSDEAAEAVILVLDQMVGSINRVVAYYATLHGETMHDDDGDAEGLVQSDGAEGARAPNGSADLEGRGGEPNAG